jgi:hypothetical protein
MRWFVTFNIHIVHGTLDQIAVYGQVSNPSGHMALSAMNYLYIESYKFIINNIIIINK